MQLEGGIQEIARTRGNEWEWETTGTFRCSEKKPILFHSVFEPTSVASHMLLLCIGHAAVTRRICQKSGGRNSSSRISTPLAHTGELSQKFKASPRLLPVSNLLDRHADGISWLHGSTRQRIHLSVTSKNDLAR